MNSEHKPKRLRLDGEGCEGHMKHREDAKNMDEKQQLDQENQTHIEIPVSGPSNPQTIVGRLNDDSSSKIFKLDIDCFEEVFDYLSFEDLLSFGETCKKLQTFVAGYNKVNFSGRYFVIWEDEICSNDNFIPAINQIIISLQCIFNQISYSLQPLYDINTRIEQFSSLKHVSFYNMDLILVEPDYERIQNIFDKIESVQLRSCLPEFCTKCLNLSGNLKRIYIRSMLRRPFLKPDDYHPWLFGRYSKLEYFRFISDMKYEIDGLNGFLERNPNIRTFATSELFLWTNRNQFLNSKAKLDILRIDMDIFFDETLIGGDKRMIQSIFQLINQLFEHGFFQRLHLLISKFINDIDEVASLHSLEKLSIINFMHSYSLRPLTLVKELIIINGVERIDVEQLAEQCVKLEKLYLGVNTVDDFLPFVRRSAKLNKLTLIMHHTENLDIVMSALNEERQKLPGARKLIIYVPDHIFVDTKRTTRNGDVNLSSIELRRGEEYDDFLDREIH